NAATAYNRLVSRIAALSDEGTVEREAFENLREGFTAALDNDLNTSLAITAIYDALKANVNDATKKALIADYDSVLSLGLLSAAERYRINAAQADSVVTAPVSEEDRAIADLVARRTEAKKARNFALADSIRDELKKMGVVVEDTPQGSKWKRV
ncbi:MAG: cysteine--tRNA ligase, partial [Clostridiales bacterium]|nr:cysteine--tRNA ligase [Clostridiales bacterium]